MDPHHDYLCAEICHLCRECKVRSFLSRWSYDRFYRADSARSRNAGRTGLGLPIVRAIVEAHGGEVMAACEGIGRGSTFSIRLPV